MNKKTMILDRYPVRPTTKTLVQIAEEFSVSKQFVSSIYPPSRNVLTRKRKDYARKRVLNRMGMAQAVLATHDTKNRLSAKQIANKLEKNPQVQAYMESLLEKAGLSDEQIAQGMKQMEKQGLASNTAEAKDVIKIYEMSMKLKDRFPSQKHEVVSKRFNIDVNAAPDELLDKLREITEENQKLLAELGKKKIEGVIEDAVEVRAEEIIPTT